MTFRRPSPKEYDPKVTPNKKPQVRRTTEFTERPHVGQLHDHTHRMGLLLAARTSTPTDHF
ncbi:hypothetical protein AB0C45_30070 [Streptomyces cyaneofuscatus]|uniref:hypothetical protein n=1 Tax=Streptomyces cyaneofuscatus TaxID=66883 RepID=UPI0033F7E774